MIFKHYTSEVVARIFFNGYVIGTLCLGLVSLYGVISGAGVLSTLSGLIYLIIVSLLTFNKRFRRSPFSIIFCFFTFLFLNVPVAFVLFEGSNYMFGEGLASTPYAQADYQRSLPLAFIYLLACWLAIWLGIVSIKQKIKIVDYKRSSISVSAVILLTVIVLIVTWIDNAEFAAVHLVGAEKVNSILAFLFFDHAFLVLAGIVLFIKLNEEKCNTRAHKITPIISIIFFAFVILHFIAGSKAAILVIFVLLVLSTFSFSREHPRSQVLFPRPIIGVVLALLAPLLFYFALVQRINLSSGITPDLGTLLASISALDTAMIQEVPKEIFYRLSHGGLDRYLLIFHSFIIDGYDQVTTMKFANYLYENTINLLLPGTPYPESYAPSSQLFSQVIQKSLVGIGGGADPAALIKSLNTQPYTIFGVFMVIFGLIAPIFLYLSMTIFIFIYNCIDNIFLKITMLYFFLGALSSFGFEVVIGNSAHLFVSILCMYFLLKISSHTKTRLSIKSTHLYPSVST